MLVEFVKDGSVCLYHPGVVAIPTYTAGLDIQDLVTSKGFRSHGTLTMVLLVCLDSLDGIESACRDVK